MVKIRRTFILTFLFSALFSWALPAQETPRDNGQAEPHQIEGGDPEMLAAFDAARRSVAGLIMRFRELKSQGIYATVKVPVRENGVVEHIWLSDIRFSDGQVHGFLSNTPLELPTWSYGDPISVRLDQISDWMVISNGHLIGGYTLFVIRDRLTGEDRVAFEREVGLIFPPAPVELSE